MPSGSADEVTDGFLLMKCLLDFFLKADRNKPISSSMMRPERTFADPLPGSLPIERPHLLQGGRPERSPPTSGQRLRGSSCLPSRRNPPPKPPAESFDAQMRQTICTLPVLGRMKSEQQQSSFRSRFPDGLIGASFCMSIPAGAGRCDGKGLPFPEPRQCPRLIYRPAAPLHREDRGLHRSPGF